MMSSATKSRTKRSFDSAAYLERLMAELNRAEICRRMARARDESGLTQPEIAELLDPPVHFRTVQLWETGEKDKRTGKHRWSPPFGRLAEWARLTGVERDWLLHGDELVLAVVRLEALEAQVARLAPAQMVQEGFEALKRAIERLGEQQSLPDEQPASGGLPS